MNDQLVAEATTNTKQTI